MENKENKGSKENKKDKSSWFPAFISIIITVILAVGSTWYTIYYSKEELEQADREKLKNVKENLVAIVEEHIVNKDTLDLKSFERLVTNRVSEERLKSQPSLYGLLTQAEFNIKNSRHLSFEKKKEYSSLISTLYFQISNDTTFNFNMDKHQADVALIVKSFNSTSERVGKEALANLINLYERELAELRRTEVKKETITDYLFKSPIRLLLLICSYTFIAATYFYLIRRKRKRKKLQKNFKEKCIFEIQSLTNELDNKIEEIQTIEKILLDSNVSKENTLLLKERLEFLKKMVVSITEERGYKLSILDKIDD